MLFRLRKNAKYSPNLSRWGSSGGLKSIINSITRKVASASAGNSRYAKSPHPKLYLNRLFSVIALFTLTSAQSDSAAKAQSIPSNQRRPMVLELFTSEGCSSCPEADALVSALALRYPDSLFCLSEHVDYWNYLGWKDPNSSKLLTDRQLAYAKKLNLSTVYTPQIVANGTAEGVGNTLSSISRVVGDASSTDTIPLKVTCKLSADRKVLDVEVSPTDLPQTGLVANLAITSNDVASKVSDGENAGRLLTHKNVVTQFLSIPLPRKDQRAPNKFSIALNTSSSAAPEKSKLTVFFQEHDLGKILAVGRCNLSATSK